MRLLATTYWSDVYPLIKAKLMTDLVALADARGDPIFDEVYFGKKVQPKKFPCAIVRPERIRPRVTTVRSSQYPMMFDIRAIAKDTSPDLGDAEVITLLGRITKMFEDDRQWGGHAATVEVDDIVPEVDRPRVRTRFEGAVIVRFMRYVLPI